MAQIIYAMQFKGQASPVSESPMVMNAETSSPSSSIISTVGANGLEGGIQPASGEEAKFESTIEMTSEANFQEKGTITFGPGNRLYFDTVGEGTIGASAEEGVSHGSIMWKITNGQGQFEGASGLITSNFTLDGSGNVVDNQFGVIYLK